MLLVMVYAYYHISLQIVMVLCNTVHVMCIMCIKVNITGDYTHNESRSLYGTSDISQ